MKLCIVAAVLSVLMMLSPAEANYCVNCDTFLSCLVVCRDGRNKLERADRWGSHTRTVIIWASSCVCYSDHPVCYSDHLIIILCVTGMFTTQATEPARCQGGEIGSHSKTSYEDLDCNYWLEDKLTKTIFVWPSKEFNKYLIIIFFIDFCFLLKWKTSFTRKPKFIVILDLIQTYWSLITTKTERFK